MKWRNNPNKTISLETQKAYLIAVRVLTQRGAIPSVDVEKRKVYQKAMLDKAKETGEVRGKLLRKSNLKDHPDLKYEDIQQKRKEFEEGSYMTAKNLKFLLIVSLYVLLRPRRAEFRFLEFHSKRPKVIDKGKCYMVSNKAKTTMLLNEYKTRDLKQKEFLGLYEKDLPPKLASIIKQYVKKLKVKEKDYLFVNEKGEMYSDTAFSRLVQQSFNKVCGVRIGINDVRHLFITWITDHINKFNQNDLKQIARDCGDWSILTNIEYRLADKKNVDDTITQVIDEIKEIQQDKRQQEEDAESEGFVGGGDANVNDLYGEIEGDYDEEKTKPISNDTNALIEYVLLEIKKILLKVL
jgi:hypothetical protein